MCHNCNSNGDHQLVTSVIRLRDSRTQSRRADGTYLRAFCRIAGCGCCVTHTMPRGHVVLNSKCCNGWLSPRPHGNKDLSGPNVAPGSLKAVVARDLLPGASGYPGLGLDSSSIRSLELLQIWGMSCCSDHRVNLSLERPVDGIEPLACLVSNSWQLVADQFLIL
jgi:hypothetical protein